MGMSILISWLVLTVVIWLTALILPGIHVRGVFGALIVAAIFGVLNWALGWLLYVVIGIGTLGLGFLLAFITRWIVTAILLKLTDTLSRSLKIDGFRWALIGALVMSLLGTLAEYLVRGVA